MARLVDQVALQVQEAVEQVREARQVIALYDERMLPAARANVKEAQIGYTTGKVPFVALSERSGHSPIAASGIWRHRPSCIAGRRRWSGSWGSQWR